MPHGSLRLPACQCLQVNAVGLKALHWHASFILIGECYDPVTVEQVLK